MRLTAKPALTLLAAALLGVVVGLGGYTFVYAKGGSYLTNDPQACANCHVMRSYLDSWVKSPHRAVAVCNDCHTPPGLLAKYATKAINGYHHSYAFTTGRFHEPLAIGPRNREITELACRKCHAELVDSIEGPHRAGREISCIRCHWDVGHL